MECSVSPYQRTMVIPRELLYVFQWVKTFRSVTFQIVGIKPTLHARTSFISYNQSYGNIKSLVYHPGKEITRGRTVTYRWGVDFFPLAIGVFLWSHRHHTGNLHVMDSLELSRFSYVFVVVLYRTIAKSLDRHFHVALTCTHPNFTRKDICQGGFLSVVKRNRQWFVTGFGSLDAYHPFSILACLGGIGVVVPRCSYLDGLPWLIPSPESSIWILL